MIFKVAWRNIWRNPARSLVVIASVAAGLYAGMLLIAIFNGFVVQEIDSAVHTQLAHIQIHAPAFSEDKDIKIVLPNGTELEEKLKNIPGITGVSGRIITTGMISSATAAAGMEIHGIDARDEQRVSKVSEMMLQGSYFKTPRPNSVVLGSTLAEKLGVKMNSKIVLTFQSATGDLTAGSFRISGIFKTTNSMFDQSTVFVQKADLATITGTLNNLHEIAILCADIKQVDATTSDLKKQYPALKVESWKEISPEMAMVTSIFDQMMYIIIGIILLALMFGIINTMLMAVLERQREFGILMAIGMNKPRIFMMILWETVILTMAGIPVGIGATLASLAYLSKAGLDLTQFSKSLSQYGIGNIIYPVLQPAVFLPITIFTAITAILSALYPAWKALRFKPAVAIHKI